MSDLLSILVNSLSVIFFVIGLGYACKKFGFIPPDANKGIGPMVGKICLPMLIFRNVAQLNLATVEWGVIMTAAIMKILSFLIGLAIAFLTKPKEEKRQQRAGGLPTVHVQERSI